MIVSPIQVATIKHNKAQSKGYTPVVDPGFPIGGVLTHWGALTSNTYAFRQKHAKTKELDPVGGGMPGAPLPPGSANALIY